MEKQSSTELAVFNFLYIGDLYKIYHYSGEMESVERFVWGSSAGQELDYDDIPVAVLEAFDNQH